MNLQNIQNSVHNYYLRGEINQAVGVCRLQKNVNAFVRHPELHF